MYWIYDHADTYGSALFIFTAGWYSIVLIYHNLFIYLHISAVSSVLLLQYSMNIFIYVPLHTHTKISLKHIWGMECLEYSVSSSSNLSHNAKLFSIWTGVVFVLSMLYTLNNTWYTDLVFSHFHKWVILYSQASLCIFLNTRKVKYVFNH